MEKLRWALGVLIPVLAFLAALLAGAAVLAAVRVNPLAAFRALFAGAFGDLNAAADTAVRATPLLFIGLGICIAFRAGVLNIGGEGQLVAGAVAATAFALWAAPLPGWLLAPLALAGGAAAGALWGAIAGLLKAHLKVNEILSTIMLNYIAVNAMNYLLRGPLMDPRQIQMRSFIPQTARLARAVDLPRLVPTRLHLGAAVAVVLAVLVFVLLWRTTVGFRLRVAGANPQAALRAGIDVKRYTVLALLLAGLLGGLGGAVEVLGVHHRMFTDGSAFGFTGSAGFNGIVAALFGRLHPLGTVPSSLLLGALLTGANRMQRAVQVPAALIGALNGLIVLFVVGSDVFRRRWERMKESEAAAAGGEL
jgi:simple sugar transport system permease protein